MNISVIGATGNIGREIAISIIREKLLDKDANIQLVGRKNPRSERALLGLSIDIADSYAEIMPNIELVNSHEDVRGGIIVMVGGMSMSKAKSTSRDDLAKQNSEIFHSYAEQIKKNCGNAIVIIITNPVELGVHIFCKYLPRNQVIGMGAYLDTMRFQNEIAMEFNVRRNSVHGLVLGEHGTGLVPIWSSVKIYGLKESYSKKRIDIFVKKRQKQNLQRHLERICELIGKGQIEKFYESFYKFGPDSRVFLGPLVSNFTGAKTIAGATGATMRLLRTIISSNIDLAACQVKLEGEFLGIHGVIGAPVFICNNGIFKVEKMNNLWDSEKKELLTASENINEKLERWE
ncbi:MAG: malate dehydrogenase [Candidatus Anammoxibacter sp.]